MVAAKGFRVSAHSVHSLHAHLVFAPKYRRKVITLRVFETMRVAWRQVCEPLGVVLAETNFEGDHVHLLLSYPPKVALSTLVQRLKGTSAPKPGRRRFPVGALHPRRERRGTAPSET